MICGACGSTVWCNEHGDAALDEFDNDGPLGWGLVYACGACVREFGTAIGAVLHACEAPVPLPCHGPAQQQARARELNRGLEEFMEESL